MHDAGREVGERLDRGQPSADAAVGVFDHAILMLGLRVVELHVDAGSLSRLAPRLEFDPALESDVSACRLGQGAEQAIRPSTASGRRSSLRWSAMKRVLRFITLATLALPKSHSKIIRSPSLCPHSARSFTVSGRW